MINVKNAEYRKMRDEIIKYLRKNSFAIMRDHKNPKRDKVAMIGLMLGFPIYKIMYKMYSRY